MNEQQKNLQKLEELLKVIGNTMTKEEFVTAFEQVVEIILTIEKRTTEAVDSLEQTYKAIIEKMKGDHTSTLADLKKQVNGLFVSDRLDEMKKTVDDRLLKVKNGKDGKSIKGDPGRPGRDGSADSPVIIRNKLETLKGAERLKASAIEGLDEIIAEAKKNGQEVRFSPGPSRGMFVYVGGVKKGLISNLNFVAGTGMAIAYSKVNGQDTITLTVTGSGTTVETPPEAPNAVRVAFTVSAQPKWVVADGTTYYEGAGYSYAALTVTMDIAPSSFIRAII